MTNIIVANTNAVTCSLVTPTCPRHLFSVGNFTNNCMMSNWRLPRRNSYCLHFDIEKATQQSGIKKAKQSSFDLISSFDVSSSIMGEDNERSEQEGIKCYEDENGEMICEGFDEGPRYYPTRPRVQRKTSPWRLPRRNFDHFDIKNASQQSDIKNLKKARQQSSLDLISSIMEEDNERSEHEGIKCYEDENGKMICEGFDEGPRPARLSLKNCASAGGRTSSMLLELLSLNINLFESWG